MVFGWDGYSEVIEHQVQMGNLLRKKLAEDGWSVLNSTPLPLVCFTDAKRKNDLVFAKTLCERIVKSGEAWVSVYPVNGINTIRACITNYNTSVKYISSLVDIVNKYRSTF